MARNAAIVGLGVELIGIGLFVWWPDPPAIIPLLFVIAGLILILYAASSSFRWSLALLPDAIPLPIMVRRGGRSIVTRYGVTLAAATRWKDSVGKPIVSADEGKVRSVWAALQIDVRNRQPQPQRITDLYMEFLRGRLIWRRVFATADPAQIDHDDHWNQRRNPRQVDWLLEPVSPAVSHYVRFARGWMPNDPTAPEDPKRFSARVVAEVGGEDRKIVLELEEDIMALEDDLGR